MAVDVATGRWSPQDTTRFECDFDLHGVVGVRLVDARTSDVTTVRRQLGLPPTTLDRDPDIVVRFVDALPARPLTYVGVHDTGFHEDEFLVLRGRGGAPARTRLPFDTIGGRPEIVCERGVPVVPHLLAIVNLTALSKDVLPLHASAFNVDGAGVLVTGWAKGGKTESLLAAARQGAHYVGDEWVYITPDRTMLGLPEPIRLWAWHLDQLPEVWKGRPARQRGRVTAWRTLARGTRAAAGTSGPVRGIARKALPVLERQAYVQVPPQQLFGASKMDLRGHLDTAVLVMSHSSAEITTQQAGAREVSTRMAASLAEERAPFMTHYRHFRFGCPDASSHLVETAAEIEQRLLALHFDGRPAAVVRHPYPCDIGSLGEAVLAAASETRKQAMAAEKEGGA
jgi:hypothetical protein